MKLLNLQVTPSWGESEAGCWMGLDFKIVLTSRRNSLELEGAFGEPKCQALGMCGNEYSDKHNPANTCLMRRDQMGLNRVRRWTKIWGFVEKTTMSKAGKMVWMQRWRREVTISSVRFFCAECLLLGVIERKQSPCGRGCKGGKMISWRLAQKWHFEDRLS